MKIIVEYDVPDDGFLQDEAEQLAFDGDVSGLMELTWFCPQHTARVVGS